MPFYATITITTTLVPWERICLHFGTVERWTLCFGMTCVSPYSAGIRCNMVVFSAFVGTVRSLGMHLWLFFWIVLFCWNTGGVYVCVCSVFLHFVFFSQLKNCCFDSHIQYSWKSITIESSKITVNGLAVFEFELYIVLFWFASASFILLLQYFNSWKWVDEMFTQLDVTFMC